MEEPDPSDDVQLHQSPVVRAVLWALGTLSLVLGVIGLLVPVMPTSPFLLVAAACYARASPRLYKLLLRNRMFGPIITEWRRHRSIPWRAKLTAITMLSIALSTSILFFVKPPALKLVLAVLGIGLVVWLYRIPSRDRPGR